MHGLRGGEERNGRRRHMWPVPPAPGTPSKPAAVASSVADSVQASPDCFLKDGRQIRVGDCALFQAGGAPPFIGIIRRFVTSKEDYLKLCVNWLYRPADAKLAKGILLDAAPNEVFYSFHKDVIAAASLLHPCKVAFLRKGVDLPSGISSFVCRRVYDFENKCLWWLTDQDYINERQEEVDQLLDKTRLEMHAAVQSGGRSPKRLNGPASTQQLKSGADSGTSFPSQVKGKKRDKSDQVTESIKRERSIKKDDVDSGNLRLDALMKAEIAKITDKGGLTNPEGVDKLVHLMQLDRAERKIDLAGRILLADVIAATERNECLNRFVQLRAVTVLDCWLQEAHKGKTGDDSSPKDGDKAAEELLFALLRALDKLPISLHALQNCHIGKSVNNLRSHKNPEIQKKARGLVDTWKKRVDAEIKVNDAKALASSQAVHWPGKPGFAEVPDALNKHAVSGDVTVKNSIIQPSTCRALPSKPGHGDAIVKSTPVTMGSLKLPSSFPASGAISSKDSLPTAVGSSGNSDLPHMVTKEEKSSSSSQSLNNSQSCSSDLIKTMGSSWKEDARSSTAGSMSVGKSSSGSSRHRRSNNGFPGNSVSGIQKAANLGKTGSLARATTVDKVPQGVLTCERSLDVPVSDQGNGHRLIIRLPNQGRGPPQAVAAGPFEDPSIIGSRASSPSNTDKHENNDRKIKVRGDRSHIAVDVNAESRQSSASKVLAGCDEIDQSTTAILDDDPRSCGQKEKSTDVSKIICTSGNEKGSIHIESKPRNAFSSMNALIESCVKHSEASAAMSSGDDIGINLLASVAAGEISKSDLISSTASPGSLPAIDEPGKIEAKPRLSCDTGVVQSNGQTTEIANVHSDKHGVFAGSVLARKESQEMGTSSSGDKKITLPEYKIGEHAGQKPVSKITLHKATDSCIKSEVKLEDERADKSVSVCTPADVKDEMECDEARQYQEKRKNSVYGVSNPSSSKLKVRTSLMDENISTDCCEKVLEGEMIPEDNKQIPNLNRCRDESTTSDRNSEKMVVLESLSCLPFDNNGPCGGASTEQQMTSVTEKTHAENEDLRGDGASSITEKLLCAESADSKTGNFNGLQVSHVEPIDSQRKEYLSNCAPSSNDENAGSVRTPVATIDGVEETVDRKEVAENHPVGSTQVESSPTHPSQEADRGTKSTGSRLSGADADRTDEAVSSAEASSVSVVAAYPDTPAKIDFDLNEGIAGDDGNQSEPATSPAVVCSPAVHLPCLSSFSACSIPNGSTATITVAAPAKGSFIPPENLCKAEPGWKGSAATSAFRPAEPRKVLEMPLTTVDLPSSSVAAAGKRKRPLFDIDLNVPDEQSLEDMVSQSSAQTTGSESGVVGNRDGAVRSSGGLDLDLNLVGEGGENGQFLGSTSCRLDRSVLPARPASRGQQPIADANTSRDFDLNNGPGFDEVGTTESLPRSQYAKINSTVPILPSIAGLRVNNPEFGSVSSWFPPGNSYPAVTIPSFLPDRGDYPYPFAAPTGSQRIMGSVAGSGTFAGDIYRGPVLSSSPAMAFSPATTFPYAGFQFGSSFPVASTSFSGGSTSYVDLSPGGGSCYPAIPSQFVGPAGALSSHYPRPHLLSLPEGGNSGGSDSSRRWTRQGLDLNAGPGNGEADVKDDRVPSALRQHPVASSQAFVEEQARLYQVAGGAVKRKEPEGGWDSDRFSGYKQHSWQ